MFNSIKQGDKGDVSLNFRQEQAHMEEGQRIQFVPALADRVGGPRVDFDIFSA